MLLDSQVNIQPQASLSNLLDVRLIACLLIGTRGLKGVQGDPGPLGVGSSGSQGPYGVPGFDGPLGSTGEIGPKGVGGTIGEPGSPGRNKLDTRVWSLDVCSSCLPFSFRPQRRSGVSRNSWKTRG